MVFQHNRDVSQLTSSCSLANRIKHFCQQWIIELSQIRNHMLAFEIRNNPFLINSFHNAGVELTPLPAIHIYTTTVALGRRLRSEALSEFLHVMQKHLSARSMKTVGRHTNDRFGLIGDSTCVSHHWIVRQKVFFTRGVVEVNVARIVSHARDDAHIEDYSELHEQFEHMRGRSNAPGSRAK